jgi:DNA-binding response OmpR family regulator
MEFGLLAGLLAHSDEFLSRNRLVSVASLPVPDDEQEAALSLHVEGLRKKINPLDSSTNFIVHEPHLGYRFTIRPEARFA